MFRNLLNDALLVKVADPTVAGTDPIVSAIVDLAGFRGAVFFTSVGTANAGNYITVQQDDVNSAGGMADLTGTKVTSGSSDEDLIVAVERPSKRYLQCTVTRGSSSTCGDIWCLRYGAAQPQLANNSVSGTQVAEQHMSPAEGTA